jgi:hypothetical protein
MERDTRRRSGLITRVRYTFRREPSALGASFFTASGWNGSFIREA